MTPDHQPRAVPLEEQRDRILREYEEATLGGVWTNLIPRAVREYFDRRIAERDGPPMTPDPKLVEAHECKESAVCRCYLLALEPNEDCPVHGHPWPPRCDCGRFVQRRHTDAT